nr:hypothetical protein [Kribbella qitaiheensis]
MPAPGGAGTPGLVFAVLVVFGGPVFGLVVVEVFAFGVAVPAVAALLHAEAPVRVGAGRALADQRGTTRHPDYSVGAGLGVEHPVEDRAHAHAVTHGQVPDDVQREPVKAALRCGEAHAASPQVAEGPSRTPLMA